MEFNFKDINKRNWQDVIKLKVKDNQKDFIESNAVSIAESKYIENWMLKGIYLKEELIGFAMYGYFQDEKRLWLDRFMIDYKFQGKGYGKKALEELIDYILNEFNSRELYLSVFEDNKLALKVYKSIGFEFNGEVDIDGELIMVLKYS